MLVFVLGAAALAAAPRAWLSDGPPPGHTGGFGEPTCVVCHQPPATSRQGTLEIEGLPAVWQPDSVYQITVVSRQAGLRRAGFQLAVRFAPGSTEQGSQAGVLSLVEPMRTAITASQDLRVLYANHLLDGTYPPAPGEVRWMLRWRAPSRRAPVAFHAASVFASDDNSPLDDEVRVTARIVPPAIP